jgi:hypothetical protein
MGVTVHGAGTNTSTKRKRVGCRRARAEALTRLRFVLVLAAPAPPRERVRMGYNEAMGSVSESGRRRSSALIEYDLARLSEHPLRFRNCIPSTIVTFAGDGASQCEIDVRWRNSAVAETLEEKLLLSWDMPTIR